MTYRVYECPPNGHRFIVGDTKGTLLSTEVFAKQQSDLFTKSSFEIVDLNNRDDGAIREYKDGARVK